MKSFFRALSLCFFVISPGALISHAGECLTANYSCSYYSCMSAELQCTANNYLRKFAYRYCTQFVDEAAMYTSAGREFMDRVRPCLQERLEGEPRDEISCQNVADKAFRHHEDCYVDSGYCELPQKDQERIARTIVGDVLLHPFMVRTGRSIEHQCLLRRLLRARN